MLLQMAVFHHFLRLSNIPLYARTTSSLSSHHQRTQNATNEQATQTNLETHTTECGGFQRGRRGVGGMKRVKGVKYKVMEGD